MVLYSAADLIWATRIKGTADALGVACRPARNAEMLRARLEDSDVRALLVDLDAPEAARELMGVLRGDEAGERERGVRVICWGPHVAVDVLQEMRDLGANEVMTRGAFSHGLPELLVKLGGGGAG